jgi:hypothetical protein
MRPIKPSRDRSKCKYITKYFKQYIIFRTYAGILKENKRLRRAISIRRAKLFTVYIETLK